MNLEKYKSDYLDRRMQLILFYRDGGEIVYSTETLFKALSFKRAYDINLFVESISSVLEQLTPGEPLTFSCINSEIDEKNVFYDYQFEVHSADDSDLIVMQVFNFSDHYENLTHMQQERNELEIHQEILKVEQEKISAQNELLAYKNNELERIQKLKTDFFARVSHEIRNPVNGISGIIRLITEDYQDKNKVMEYLDALSSTSDHLVNIVNNVLDFSKLESKGQDLEIEQIEFNCRSLVKSIINSFLFNANKKKVVIDTEIENDIPELLIGDKYKLTQVLTNLMGNALKFTDEGTITLKMSLNTIDDSTRILFELQDSGIGISEDMLKNIFNPYVQADQSVQRVYGGTGLGLPIVQQLVKAMNGTIHVSSILGEGSKFSVNIPFKIVHGDSGNLSETTKVTFDGKILIGEDDLINQKVMEGMFKLNRIECDMASNGEEVLNLYRKYDYDLFILDVNMPIIDGLEAALRIRKHSNKPIIICSGKPYSELEDKLNSLSNIKYIQKPISYPKLLSVISDTSPLQKELVDFKLLKDLFGNNQKRINEIVAIFIEEAPLNIENMKRLFHDHEYNALKELVHKAKSSFAYFGMKDTHELCSEIENDLEKNIKRNYLLDIKRIEEDAILAIEELNKR